MENKSKILLLEDEEDIRELICMQLTHENHEVDCVTRGDQAIDQIQQKKYDLFVLDRLVPGQSGLEVCKFIRNYRPSKTCPILIVTALTRNEDIVQGLEAGADDYITKPFEINILMARVKALLRRYRQLQESSKTPPSSEISFGRIKLNTDLYKVWVDDKLINLTGSEYKLLSLLIQNSRRVLGRKELVRSIQGNNVHVTERTVDTQIFGLRKKLGPASNIIETIRGIGYRVNEND